MAATNITSRDPAEISKRLNRRDEVDIPDQPNTAMVRQIVKKVQHFICIIPQKINDKGKLSCFVLSLVYIYPVLSILVPFLI